MLLALVPAFPQAQPNTQVFDMPFDVTWPLPCANGGIGEDVHISGTVHAVTTTVINKNAVTAIFTFNPVGLTGVGLTTGTLYHVVGITRQTWNVQNAIFPVEITFVNKALLIGQGSAPNGTYVFETQHISINANGVTTVNFDNVVFRCQ